MPDYPTYERLQSLDHLCTWPQNLYPDGPPKVAIPGVVHEKLSPHLGDQLAIDRADAWI